MINLLSKLPENPKDVLIFNMEEAPKDRLSLENGNKFITNRKVSPIF
jgi:hypothetical protein